MNDTTLSDGTADARAAAVKRLTARRDFGGHVVAYLVVNAAVLAIWLVTGHGYFWPGWVLGGWGIGLALHAWDVFGRRPISEDDIRREMTRQAGDRPWDSPPRVIGRSASPRERLHSV